MKIQFEFISILPVYEYSTFRVNIGCSIYDALDELLGFCKLFRGSAHLYFNNELYIIHFSDEKADILKQHNRN